MFFGEYTHTIDAKGRVIIPSRLREAARHEGAGEAYYVTRGVDRCLYIYTPARWEEVVRSMRQGGFAKRKMRDFSRYFFSSAAFVTPDAQGRIHLPEKLRKLASLERDVIFVGVQDRIEIWNAESWKSFEDKVGDDFEDMVEDISGELF